MTDRISSLFGGRTSALVALGAALFAATTAHATTIFTSNLSSITTPAGDSTGNNFQLGFNGGAVAGISNTFFSPGNWGFNFVFSSPSQANLVGAFNQISNQSMKLDGAILADSADTQDNGYFLALDSVYEASPINISLSTIAGATYSVSFDFGGAQETGFVGTTTDFLTVGLTGSASQVTGSVTVPQQGFTGWNAVTDTFTAATTGTEVLSFLAGGTPTGNNQEPAMTLLDNISVSQVTVPPPPPTPEPSSLLLLATGMLATGGYFRYRMKKGEASL